MRAVGCLAASHRRTKALWVQSATFLLLLPDRKRMKKDHSRSQTQEFRGGGREMREPLEKDTAEVSKGISHGVDSGNRLFER